VGTTADLVRDGLMSQLLYSAGAGQLYTLRWNGTGFTATLGVEVETSEAHKVTNLSAAWALDDDVAATSIGYGGTGATVSAEVWLVPDRQTGATDRFWRYAGGTWTGITPPVAAWQWRSLVASPFNPNHLLAFGNTVDSILDLVDGAWYATGTTISPLWYSSDGGANWSNVALTGATGAPAQMSGALPVWSRSTGGRWMIPAQNAVTSRRTVVWIGNGVTASPTTTLNVAVDYACALSGDTYAGYDAYNRTLVAIAADGSITTAPGTPFGGVAAAHLPLGVPFTRGVLVPRQWGGGASVDTLFRTTDVTTAQPVQVGTTGGWPGMLAWLGNRLFGARIGYAEINEILTPLAIPSIGPTIATSGAIRWFASDAQTQTRAAALMTAATSLGIVVGDGTTWTQIPTNPPGVDATMLSEWIEVIVR